MGYGRRRNWKGDRRDDRHGRARPKLAITGAIVLVIGILLIFYVADVKQFDYATMIGGLFLVVGTMMLLLSMSKRKQGQFVKGMDVARGIFKESCQCCKCQNCGRSHNHWTHDDHDERRRHY